MSEAGGELAPVVPAELIEAPALALLGAAPPPSRQPATMYLEQLGEGSQRTMRTALASLAHIVVPSCKKALARCECIRAFPWHRLGPSHTSVMRRRLMDRLAPATVNKTLAALRGTLKEAWRLGLMEADDYHRAADVRDAKGSKLPAGRHLSDGELRALFAACARDESAAGARDASAFGLMYGCGLRRSEVVALDLDHVVIDSGEVRVFGGKGGRDRITYAPPGARTALRTWAAIRGAEEGPLLFPLRSRSEVLERRMTDQALLYLCRRRGAEAQIAAFTPHDLRRTWIGNLLSGGTDISIVKQLAGHANVATTTRYDRRPEEAKQQASEALLVPYRLNG